MFNWHCLGLRRRLQPRTVSSVGYVRREHYSDLCLLLVNLLPLFLTCFVLGQEPDSKFFIDSTRHSARFSNTNVQVDGPYIIRDTLYRVNKYGKFIKETAFRKDSISVQVANAMGDAFTIAIAAQHEIPLASYPLSSKLIAISDIEGEFDALAGFLMANQVIDKDYNWVFGTGHLVLLGDFVDRGKNVVPTLWLIYKLEQQALLHNGMVHFILGNHEVFNFRGDFRYNDVKYVNIAKRISGKVDRTEAVKFMYSTNSELGNWLSKKNTIEKIGTYLFVHGGLSEELLNYRLTIQEINDKVRSAYYFEMDEIDAAIKFLYSNKGPFWYRGLVFASRKEKAFSAKYLVELLDRFDSHKVVVGHTHVDSISIGLDGRLLMLDVPHGRKRFSGKTKGLLIENGHEFVINDLGVREVLRIL